MAMWFYRKQQAETSVIFFYQIFKLMVMPLTYPSLGSSIMSNRNMTRQFNSLFNANHLQFIHSTYLGSRGVTESTLAKHPFHNAFMKILSKTRQCRPDVDTYVMKMALLKYMTSFKNMWSIKGRMNKLLHRLINTLLKIHLAPMREKNIKDS